MRKVIMLYGPPGSGKGTQANLLAGKLGMVHFDTGKYLEQVVHDPTTQKNPEIRKAGKIFDSGALVDPAFVLKLTAKKSKEIAKAGFGLVFSGSPRTVFEAFGDKNHEGLISVLEKNFGKKNMVPIFLKIQPELSILRNAKRKICSICGTAILYSDATHHHKTCPLCGGGLKRRTVDNPKVFRTRIKEYKERTLPILAGLKKRRYKIISISGRPMPYRVFDNILKKLSAKRK
ncbi:MAG: nucleoside monophosphate kinase [Candidatus Harrisonbacteria bacterium]|nr:nucleoside monophosphate kinase [Candidatus Harrisonbacteria bacterium]